VIRFFFNLTRGHFRRHRLEALLCLAGVALGVAVVVAIDSAVAACVDSFRGAVDTLAERSTHSIFADNGTVSDADYIALLREHPPVPLAPVIDRGVLVESGEAAGEGGWSDNAAVVARLVGVDVFSESAMRSFTQMQSALDHHAFERFMTEPGEVVLVAPLARRLGVRAGDSLRLTAGSDRRSARVAGVIDLTGVARAQMTDLIVADLATAQELTGLIGQLDRIDVKIDSPDQEARLSKMLPPGIVLRSTQQQKTNFAELIGSYRMNLSALSMMAAFVAIFIVYNSMLISVRQRLPALGILRCLGASRWQLGGIYLIEAVVFAVVGGAIGVLGGWALSRWMVGLVATTINDLYAAVRPDPVALDQVEILKGFAVALGSCLIGAAVPLWQASRTPPINAFAASRSATSSARIAGWLLAAGLAVLAASMGVYYAPGNSAVAGFVMAMLIAIGFALLCPAITRAACRLAERIARPAQLLPVQMAAAGVGRTLGITGVAVAAMMLAMSMNVGVRTMTSSFRSALSAWINRRFDADVFLAPELLVNHHIDAALDPSVEKWVRQQPQFASAVATRATYPTIGGVSTALVAGDILPMLADGTLPMKSTLSGTFDPQRDALISEPLAGRLALRAGDVVTLHPPAGPRQFRIFGIFYEFGNEHGECMIDRHIYAQQWHDPLLTTLHVRLRPGNDPAATAAAWAEHLRPKYPVAVNSFADIRTEILTVFDRTFKVTDVLSWLAGGVAFCGLAGALLALALARQRDYSVLAAIGMTGRQTAQWLLAQGFLIAWISAAIAAVAGTALAYVLAYVIQYRSFGWSIPTSPWPRYWAEDFVLATAAAIVAMIYPAWRLRRSPPAGSLREE
jgi:putative ABC transport system permease protein